MSTPKTFTKFSGLNNTNLSRGLTLILWSKDTHEWFDSKNGQKTLKYTTFYFYTSLVKFLNKVFWSRLSNNGLLILKFAIVDENTTGTLLW